MSTPFPPSREADLVTFVGNFGSKISATPTAYGLTATQATAFGALKTAFISAYNVAQDDATRSPMNVSLKNVAKANLVANIRLLAGIVQRFPGTTNAIRLDLGLPQRFMPAPIPPPSSSPLIEIKSVKGRTVTIKLINTQEPTRRAKPAGTIGASIFSHVGETVPADINDWTFQGSTGRQTVSIQFPSDTAPGAKVWITAFWFNPRKEAGDACDPISTNLPGGGVSAETETA
jgi:hypothetical protein